MNTRILLVKCRGRQVRNMAVTPPMGVAMLASCLRASGAVETVPPCCGTGQHAVCTPPDVGTYPRYAPASCGARPSHSPAPRYGTHYSTAPSGRVDVRLFDAVFPRDPERALREQLLSFKPHVVGLSAMTSEERSARRLAGIVKSLAPETMVVLGGPHATVFTHRSLECSEIDVAVIGEGEETLTELVALCGSGGVPPPEVLASVPGLAYRGLDGRVAVNSPRPVNEALDSLPVPAWDLLDLTRYARLPGMASGGMCRYAPLLTSRGCPYRCIYCHSLHGKRFRARSIESVVAEIEELIRRYGVEELEVLDDIANFDVERFSGILERILERGLRVRLSFPNGLRLDRLDEETIQLLARVGTGEVSVAVETASPRLQRLLRKNLDLDRARWAVERLAAQRIFTRGFFILGLPTESEAEMRGTIDLACRLPLHLALFFTANPFPGTELQRMLRDSGRLPRALAPHEFQYLGACFNGGEVPDQRFQMLYRQAWLRFYGNPVRLARILRDRRSWSDLPSRALHMVRNAAS